ncbi:helix-turn-helix domain-containing protein [Heyndrickxia camelliae]|uniref:XRE family transcriptional regulator n=1 Tax=Heyndrickxia camelliae TaxID=1707093 RepID=A0A2N3LH58_9BACI|nr:helix-turn-helix transcriptional regulator [Heyndrickxia camelliae]PKR83853.1 XRE family transcriptional regulator [Heyndrickxia camelliae]
MASFAENLKFYREQRNLSQEELALKARLGTAVIEKYESGEQIPNTETIFKLSTILDVPASSLSDENQK